MNLATEFDHQEQGRIRFLLQRDGLNATIAWVKRTLQMYRAAVLDKPHFASTDRYRRGFIESYCVFKRWLTRIDAYGTSTRLRSSIKQTVVLKDSSITNTDRTR